MKMKKSRFIWAIVLLIAFALLTIIFLVLDYNNLIPKKAYDASDFGIQVIQSENDMNGNGIDDYTDILLGAQADAHNKPKYKSQYYAGGYPPSDEGVCSDVIWRAFFSAGYNLKDLVDEHIKNNLELYPRVGGKPDENIDFRRVPNLKVFFEYCAVSYSLDPTDIGEWQPGDIVIFGKKYTHIGIISDIRNKEGVAYMIHNAGQPVREEDSLLEWDRGATITGHYRFE